MRSSKAHRLEEAERPFAAELEALSRGIKRQTGCLNGSHAGERKRLYAVMLNYADELNKVRKYACPLSTSMLLSSILESLLLALVLEHIEEARKTRVWTKATSDKSRRGEKIHPDIPILHQAELIEIIDDLKLLRTRGVQQKVDELQLNYIESVLRVKIKHLSNLDPRDATQSRPHARSS